MNILSFDCSASACSVAVYDEKETLSNLCEEMLRGQSECLMPMIKQSLIIAALIPSNIDMIAVTTGPGAFTGIRIGLASARAFGLALDIPVVGISTTRAVAMAQNNPNMQDILVVIDSKRADIYVDILSPNGISKTQPKLLSLEDIAKLIVDNENMLLCGDAVPRLRPILDAAGINYTDSQENTLPNPVIVAKLAINDFIKYGAKPFMDKPRPLYIRPPDASLPKSNPCIIVNQ